MLWEHGSKAIEQFQPGERLWSRNEFDPSGPLVLKMVEEVFVWTGRIIHLHVGGLVIRTTPEHPFYVWGKEWVSAGELEIGDLLSSHDGQWVAVEEVHDTGEYETVYNLRVADYHTYFVGTQEWGFSVWAHNADGCGGVESRKNVKVTSADEVNSTFPAEHHPPYSPGSRVTRFKTGEEEFFVRVHGEDNMVSGWLMKESAIRGLSPQEIQQKYAIPQTPTLVSDVVVPKGTRMEYGNVNSPYPGGQSWPTWSRQYRLLDPVDPSAFQNNEVIMTNAGWELLENNIMVKGKSLPLPFPAAKVIEVGGLLVVLLQIPSGTINNRNVIGVTFDGKTSWQIQESPHGGEKNQPFVDIKQDSNGHVIARNWNGVEYLIDIASGEIKTVGFRRF